MLKWWTQCFCSVFNHSNYKFILRYLPVWFGVFQHWKKYLLSFLWRWLLLTSTINTIILRLRRVVFFDGSNWLITMRGEVGLQKESLQISDYLSLVSLRSLSRLFFCCVVFFNRKGAYRKLTLRENPNLVPRVLSYPSLRHSVGTGRRKPWQWSWESLSPFYLYFASQLPSYG